MDHRADTVHECIRVSAALCDLRQFLFPFRRQHGRGQRLRQDCDKVDTGFCGDQALALALHKSGCYQLFDDSRPGRRRAKTFSLRLIGNMAQATISCPFGAIHLVILACVLHSGQEGIFRVGLRRLGEMLGNSNLRTVKSLPFGEVRERAAVPIRRLFLQEGTENAVDLPPSFGEDALALCGEGIAAAIKGGRDRLIHIRLRRRTQQLAADQQEQIALAQGQSLDIRFFNLHRGNNGVMVGYVLVGNHGHHQRKEVAAAIKGRQLCRQVDHAGSRFCHVGGQIPAVRAGIGQQLLFVEALGVVEGLLRRVSEQAVCLPLQGGKVIELWRLFLLLLLCDRGTGDGRTLTHGRCLFRLCRIGELLRHRFGSVQRQAQQMIFFLVKQRDLCVTIRHHCQCGGLNTAHIQGTVIENGEKSRSIDPHQPVRFLAAECGLIQGFIIGAGAQIRKALPDSAVLHRRNPETEDRLAAAGHFIYQTEDQLTFTPGVTGIDNGIHIGAVHQGTEIFKSILLAWCQHIAKWLRQNGKIIIAPFLETLVIAARIHRGYQVPNAPGYKKAAALIKAIGPG